MFSVLLVDLEYSSKWSMFKIFYRTKSFVWLQHKNIIQNVLAKKGKPSVFLKTVAKPILISDFLINVKYNLDWASHQKSIATFVDLQLFSPLFYL